MKPRQLPIRVAIALLVAIWPPDSDSRFAWAAEFVTDDTVIFDEETLPLPDYLETFTSPDFHTQITRISNSLTYDGQVSWGDDTRHHYSKDQAWSADMTYMFIQNTTRVGNFSSSPSNLLLDGRDYSFLRDLNLGHDEIRWHPTDDNLMIYTKGNRLYKYKVAEQSSELIHTFTEYASEKYALWTTWEGNISQDGDWISFATEQPNGSYDMYAYNMATNTKGTVKNFSNHPDWVSSSPSGQYVVVDWSDTLTEVYDNNMNFIREFPANISHYDMTYDDDGVTEIAVGTSKPGGDGNLIKIPLVSGSSTVLTNRGWVDHTSTRNIQSGEWAITTYQEEFPPSNNYRKFLAEIVAVKLDGSGDVRRLAHTRSNVNTGSGFDYRSEPHASVSPDGTKIVFASNWRESDGLSINSFVIDISDLLADPFFEADFNKDAVVNDKDLIAWQSRFGTLGNATRAQGDADADGDADGSDFLIWQRQYGSTSALEATSTTVPEPNSLLLEGLGLFAIAMAFHCRSVGFTERLRFCH